MAVFGSVAIRFIAGAKVARARGTNWLEEVFTGWQDAELLGLPAGYLFYGWFAMVLWGGWYLAPW
jgi:hypothetical protein